VVLCEQVAPGSVTQFGGLSVDATRSVNMSVVKTLSGTNGASSRAMNRSSSSTMSSERKIPK